MLARDLQLTTPGPRDLLAIAGKEGPPAYFPGPRDLLVSTGQGPPAYSRTSLLQASAGQGPPAYYLQAQGPLVAGAGQASSLLPVLGTSY